MLSEKVAANERIRATQVMLGVDRGERLPFLCECEDVRCRDVIRLTADEYNQTRASTSRCVVVVGHPYEGRVVLAGEGYSVVEE